MIKTKTKNFGPNNGRLRLDIAASFLKKHDMIAMESHEDLCLRALHLADTLIRCHAHTYGITYDEFEKTKEEIRLPHDGC